MHLGANLLENSFSGKALGILVDLRLAMSQQSALVAKKANSVVCCIRRTVASSLRKVIPHLSSAPARP